MISVLFIGSLYWSVSASYQQRDGVHAVYSNVLVNRRNKNASSRKVWSGWPVDWSEFHIWPLNLMVVSHHWWQDKVSLECRSQSTRPQSSAFVFFLVWLESTHPSVALWPACDGFPAWKECQVAPPVPTRAPTHEDSGRAPQQPPTRTSVEISKIHMKKLPSVHLWYIAGGSGRFRV